MTFCLGMKMEQGLVAIADTRITSGTEIHTAPKLSTYQAPGGELFLMTSGLRSARDKAVTYFEEALDSGSGRALDRTWKAANLLGQQVRRVAAEDSQALAEAHLSFNLFALVGGRLKRDAAPCLYLLYPQGNWVEIHESRPYSIIGETNFGRPILDRTFTYKDPLDWGLKIGCLAFDSTRISANDVDFPLDIAIYEAATGKMRTGRLEAVDLSPVSQWWSGRIRAAVSEMPAGHVSALMGKVKPRSPQRAKAAPKRQPAS